ncbi:MAG: carbamoyltransferase [Flavobacteriales bacterium]|nr:carbamoyltransferase [Bacteroidota bacterium]MCB9239841.1 carbamoyltransferase [Flavobacteriales bacterium]
MAKYILGISAFYHDSAAVILKDCVVVAAAQEERFTRKKHDPSFPVQAIKYCLTETGKSLDDLQYIVFYDKPLLKLERLLETYYGFSPKGLNSFIRSMPVWLKEKMFLKRLIRDELKKVEVYNSKKAQLLFPEHHLSHAASTYYPSSFEEAAILTIDGVGEWATASIAHGKGKDITILKELRFPHSLGLLYSAFTYFLGFRVNSGEYKLMGLAPYGNPDSERVKTYIDIIKNELLQIYDDGSLWLNQKYFKYATGLRMVDDASWKSLFGFDRREPSDSLEQHHCDLALAIQAITEEVVLKMAMEAKRLTGSEYLCLAGGVALNCVSNGKLVKSGIFRDIYITPPSGDAGGALGAAYCAHFITERNERHIDPQKYDALSGAYLGPDITDSSIRQTIGKYDAVGIEFASFNELAEEAAILLDRGNVIGFVQGRMEFGPRALGARSILGDPRNEEMQKKLNLKIKYRESFRPFAPSVLAEDCENYFDHTGTSPYMLLVQPVQKSLRESLPQGYASFDLRNKLYYKRSILPAVTHIDFSARIQTVHKDTNPRYHKLISSFKSRTGCGVVVNTSFNVRGEPIVCTPDDAYRCFMRTEMDYLILNNFLFKKEDQSAWDKKDNWQEEFVLD